MYPPPSLEIAESAAARGIEQEAIERVAGADARGGEPIALGGATGNKCGGAGGAEVLPVAVALDPDYELAPLVIGAERAAGEPGAGAEIAGRRRFAGKFMGSVQLLGPKA